MRQRASSLLELLVVATVVIVLLALLLPVSGMIRDHANSAFCCNQLRQIATIYVVYSQDNRGCIPPSQLNVSQVTPAMQADGNPFGQWFRFIMPYVDDTSHFAQCPKANWKRNGHPFMSNTDVYGASYGYGGGLLGAMGLRSDEQWSMRLNRLPSPGRTALLSERWAVRIDGHFSNSTWVDAPTKTRLMDVREGRVPLPGANHASWRISHRGKANVIFADLRVVDVAPEETWRPDQSDRRGVPGRGDQDIWSGPE